MGWVCSAVSSCSWVVRGNLPDEDEQYRAYVAAVDAMEGLPVTIRTVDVGPINLWIALFGGDEHLNPAWGCGLSAGV